MAVDFFRLLDIRNRKAFSLAGRNGLTYRTRLVNKTLEIEKDLSNILPSNYQSTIGGPNYTIALRSYAIEFAKIRLALEDIEADGYFDSAKFCDDRADLVYQKLGSLLALDKDIKLSIFDSQEFCQFALSLVEVFFGGSTPANIKAGIEKFVGEEDIVTITENFLDARDPLSAFDISDQFGFRVDFELTDQISKNFQDINIKLDFLLKLIKPAHTLYMLRFIFTELVEFLKNADDTIQSQTIWDHDYDDARVYCEGVKGRDRLGTNVVQFVEETFTGISGTLIKTTYGPLSVNQVLPRIGDETDVTVLVDGEQVTVSSVAGAKGEITLVSAVTSSQTITVRYYYWKNTNLGMLLGDEGRVLGTADRNRLPVDWVLGAPSGVDPEQVTWSYAGWERDYTSVLGDPDSLLLGQDSSKLSDPDTGGLIAQHHVLGWANRVKGPDQTDASGYSHTLNEGTPIVELRISYNTVFELEDGIDLTNWEGWGEQEWGASAWGGDNPQEEPSVLPALSWKIITPGGHFVSPLNTSTSKAGKTGLLSIACEGDIQTTIGTYTDEYSTPDIPYCDELGLFTANVSNLNGSDLLNNFSGVDGCNLTVSMSTDTPFEDTSAVPSSGSDEPISSLSVGGTITRGNSYDATGVFIANTSNLNSSDHLWDNEQLGHWSDEGDITIILGSTTTHLPSYSLDQEAGPP